MIGVVKRDEALRVTRCAVQARGMLNRNDRVPGGVHDEEGAVERTGRVEDARFAEVIDERL